MHHGSTLPYLPSCIVPKTYVNGAAAVFVKTGNAVFGRTDPEFPVMILHKGGYLGSRDKSHLLQGRTQHGKSVVTARPDIALAVFEEAGQFPGGKAGRVIGLMEVNLGKLRMDGVDDA